MTNLTNKLARDGSRLGKIDPRQNRLVGALPRQSWTNLEPLLQPIHMPLGKVLCGPGEAHRYLYFPISSTIAILSTLSTGACVQIGLVGCEGLFGRAVFMDDESSSTRGVVQTAGTGLRMDASLAKAEFERGGAVTRLILRYMQTLMVEVAQTAVCSRHHSPRQQVCRWLISTLDRTGGDEIGTTHELIGHMLGVRRETVTDAMRKLHEQGLVVPHRARIRLLDRAGLEECACESYALLKRNHEGLLTHLARLSRAAL